MSVVRCDQCSRSINTDEDTDCFVEVGNMRRLHKEIALCEICRERRQTDLETAEPCTGDARDQGCTCTIPFAGPTDIDPPEPRITRDCPLHGTEPDPDDARQRRIDDSMRPR